MENDKNLTRRLPAIDALRGLVMVIMALDHVRDFFHRDAMLFSPTDLARTTPILFLTRWITHFCAPVFMLTAGMGAFLWWKRNRTRRQLSAFLLTRGVWLVLLELVVMRGAYYFDYSLQYPILLLVLWSLGACMIALAALAWLPLRLLAVLSIAALTLHNCLDGVQATHFGSFAPLWNIFHQVGAFPVAGRLVIVGYPLAPWTALIAAGFCLGRIFLMEPLARRRILLLIGSGSTLAFVILRAMNVYGDLAPWTTQRTAVYTLLSFLNCTKYPPSLDFLLMTLGPALLVLAYFDTLSFRSTNPLLVLGRVPLFFFVLHFYAAHAAAAIMAWLRYGHEAFAFLFVPMPSMGGPSQMFPAGFGYELWVVYVAWLLIVVGLYPVSRWFARVKSRRRDWWLSYL
jgi:uncharacterized membrane protein